MHIGKHELVILFEQQAMTFRVYKSLSRVDDDELLEVQEYGDLVGGLLSKRILLYRGWWLKCDDYSLIN